MKLIKYILLFHTFLIPNVSFSQQNQGMYFMHSIPESNILNPAVPISCTWYIGLPFLSSNHVNVGSNSFTFQKVFSQFQLGYNKRYFFSKPVYSCDFFTHEIHAQLFAVGYRKDAMSYIFSVTEKNNSIIVFPKKILPLLLEGNNHFLGEEIGTRGLDASIMHYREYSFSVSRNYSGNDFFGIRGKLLFGKLNSSFLADGLTFQTDESTFDLYIRGEGTLNTSLPLTIEDSVDIYRNIHVNDNISPIKLLFNPKNPGLALDFGLLKQLNKNTILSVSLTDVGFINWRSNLNTFYGNGEFAYKGPLGDTVNSEDYIGDLLNAFVDSMQVTIQSKPYITFLSPRLTAGLLKDLTPNIGIGLQTSIVLNKSKLIPSLTLSTNYHSMRNLYLMLSYSLQYSSFNNFGAGVIVGKSPLQLYIVSDNVLGLFSPFPTNNVNLRFGLNLNIGCCAIEKELKRKKGLSGKCNWIKTKSPKKRR